MLSSIVYAKLLDLSKYIYLFTMYQSLNSNVNCKLK